MKCTHQDRGERISWAFKVEGEDTKMHLTNYEVQ